jgi:hypothetical protein
VVSDYLFQKDRIFASINLSDAEMVLYDQILPLLERDLPRPDRVVYLRADLPILQKRIEKRGRFFEKGIESDYLKMLDEAYNYFFFHYRSTPPPGGEHQRPDGENDADAELIRRILEHGSARRITIPLEAGRTRRRKEGRWALTAADPGLEGRERVGHHLLRLLDGPALRGRPIPLLLVGTAGASSSAMRPRSGDLGR